MTQEQLQSILEKAQNGNAVSQLRVARFYWYGVNVEKNEAESVKWYQLAAVSLRTLADQNDLDAVVALARLYNSGRGVEKNMEEANKYYAKAASLLNNSADQGSVEALAKLAGFYANGRGVSKDLNKSLELAQKTLKGMSRHLRILYGFDFEDVEKEAIATRDKKALITLGNFYREGIGVDKNITKSEMLLQLAAESSQNCKV